MKNSRLKLERYADNLLKKKRKKNKKKDRVCPNLEKFSKKLKDDLPKSEKWFINYLNKYDIDIFQEGFKSNETFFNKYIPDFINWDRKIIIEIDGSIHNTLKQKIKDNKKDNFYTQKGFEVIRISHKDEYGAYISLSSIRLGLY